MEINRKKCTQLQGADCGSDHTLVVGISKI